MAWHLYIVGIAAILVTLKSGVFGQWWQPDWVDNNNNDVVVKTLYGDVNGYSLPLEWGERLNIFAGVPYAQAPIGDLRWKKPERPRWRKAWEAKTFRPACPQFPLHFIQKDIPTFEFRNISEDCLYLNIYAPNISYHSVHRLYPVMVWFHPGNFEYGSSQQYPGHILAQREMVIVTMNYRLGALGFLTTEDEAARGNYGLWDQRMALEFVKENIEFFRGDPSIITIFGSEAGGASVGFHMVSPRSRGKKLFTKAICQSGTDLSPFAFTDPFWAPREFALQLARFLNCPTNEHFIMMYCLRWQKSWQQILDAQGKVTVEYGVNSNPWAPTQDYTWGFMPQSPKDYRVAGLYDYIPFMAGINVNDGAEMANSSVRNLHLGLSPSTFRSELYKMLRQYRVQKEWVDRIYDALEFRYTYWSQPTNNTARTQKYIELLTDMNFGSPMDDVLKFQVKHDKSFMYIFNYRPELDPKPFWMGVSQGAEIEMVFGMPFFNETWTNYTGVIPRADYTDYDRNISEFMMDMWSNFTYRGNPTPNITRNVTWWPYNFWNLTFLYVDDYSHMKIKYRQDFLAFWREYFPRIAKRDPVFPTLPPTPEGQVFKYTTFALAAVVFVIIMFTISLSYLVYRQAKQREDEVYGGEPKTTTRRHEGTSRQQLEMSDMGSEVMRNEYYQDDYSIA